MCVVWEGKMMHNSQETFSFFYAKNVDVDLSKADTALVAKTPPTLIPATPQCTKLLHLLNLNYPNETRWYKCAKWSCDSSARTLFTLWHQWLLHLQSAAGGSWRTFAASAAVMEHSPILFDPVRSGPAKQEFSSLNLESEFWCKRSGSPLKHFNVFTCGCEMSKVSVSALLLPHSGRYSRSRMWTLCPRIAPAARSPCTCSCPAGESGRPGRRRRHSVNAGRVQQRDVTQEDDCELTCPLCSPSTTMMRSDSCLGTMVSSISCLTSARRKENIELFEGTFPWRVSATVAWTMRWKNGNHQKPSSASMFSEESFNNTII